jgi:aerobic-type carbon monoxide dehydrogenase small subunit (CoxS/CutS family)
MMSSSLHDLKLVVNGQTISAKVPAALRLADFLRDELGLTGTHIGCGEGPCGSCTVLLAGDPVRSCLMLAVQAQGCSIETIESVGSDTELHPVQAALHQHHALQCGFCTPGLVMSAVSLFRANPHPSRNEIATMLQGHLCRCTGYLNIIEAMETLAGINQPSAKAEH